MSEKRDSMLTAAIAGAGMLASAAISIVGGASQKHIADTAVKNAEEARKTSQANTSEMVSTLAPAVVTISDSMQKLQERLDQAETAELDRARQLDVPLVDAVQGIQSQVEDVDENLQKMRSEAHAVGSSLKQLETERQRSLAFESAQSDKDAQNLIGVQEDIRAYEAASNAQYDRMVHQIETLRRNFDVAKEEALAREAELKAQHAQAEADRLRDTMDQIKQERQEAQRKAQELLAQANAKSTADSEAAAKAAQDAAVHAAQVEAQLRKQLEKAQASAEQAEEELMRSQSDLEKKKAADEAAAAQAAQADQVRNRELAKQAAAREAALNKALQSLRKETNERKQLLRKLSDERKKYENQLRQASDSQKRILDDHAKALKEAEVETQRQKDQYESKIYELEVEMGKVKAFKDALIEFGPGERVLDCAGKCQPGASLSIWDKHGGDNQKWSFDPKSKAVTVKGNCLEVVNGDKGNGAGLRAWSCNGSPAQQWVVQDNKGPGKGDVQLMNTNSGKCLDVKGARDKRGQGVQLYDCAKSGHSWDIRTTDTPTDSKTARSVPGTDWKEIPGRLKQVDFDGSTAFGVNASNDVFASPAASGAWSHKSGKLVHVTIDGDRVAGVDPKDGIWYAVDAQNPSWKKLGGLLRQVSLSGGRVLGVNGSGNVFLADFGSSKWSHISRDMKYVSMDGRRAAAIGRAGEVYCADDVSNPKWKKISGTLDMVELHGNRLCGVNSAGNVYVGKFGQGSWKQVGTGCKHAVTAGRLVYAVAKDDKIFTLDLGADEPSSHKPSPSIATEMPKSAAQGAPLGEAFADSQIEFGPGERVLDCSGGECKPGSNLIIWNKTGNANQSWSYDPKTKAVTAQGHCLDVKSSGKHNGANVQAWGCNGSGAQQWVVQANQGPGQGAFQLMNPSSGKCLDVAGAIDKAGQNVQIWDCKQSGHAWDIRTPSAATHQKSVLSMNESLVSDQSFNKLSLPSGENLIMQSDGNLVLYDRSKRPVWASNTMSKGTAPFKATMQTDGNFVVYDRHNKPTWATGTNRVGSRQYAVRLGGSSFEVHDGTRSIWSSAKQSSSGASLGEAFTNAHIEFGPGTRALDCSGGKCGKGTKLHIWDKHGGGNQSWSYDPKTKAVTAQGHCLDVDRAAKHDGAKVQTWSCNGGRAQQWIVQKNQGPGQGSVQLMNPNSGKCLDVHGAKDERGRGVQLYDCKKSGHAWDIRTK